MMLFVRRLLDSLQTLSWAGVLWATWMWWITDKGNYEALAAIFGLGVASIHGVRCWVLPDQTDAEREQERRDKVVSENLHEGHIQIIKHESDVFHNLSCTMFDVLLPMESHRSWEKIHLDGCIDFIRQLEGLGMFDQQTNDKWTRTLKGREWRKRLTD